MRDLKVRTTVVETQIGHLHVADAGISGRLDRIEARLDRIERRLDLVGSELR
jgi:archaellum component FlaC